MNQMQLETLETNERDYKEVLQDIENGVLKPDLTIGNIRYFIIEKTPYSFHLYAADQLPTKVNLYEMLYDLRHRKYFLHKNGREVKFSVYNLNNIIPRPSWYDVSPDPMRQTGAVDSFLEAVSVDENKGMYKKMLDMMGAQGEEKIDMPSRALIRLIEEYYKLEILYKSGVPFRCLPEHLLLYEAANSEETKPHKILGISKQILKLVKDISDIRGGGVHEYIAPDRKMLKLLKLLTQQQLDTYRSYINFIVELEEEYDTGSNPLDEFLSNNTLNQFNRVVNNDQVGESVGNWGMSHDVVWFIHKYDVKDAKRFIKYIYFDCLTQQGMNSRTAIDYYRDYYRMNVLMENPNFEKYPRYLKTFHDITSRNFKFVEDAVAKRQFEKRVHEMKVYEWEDNNYRIVAPESTRDIVEEGQKLHHCVASYAKSVCEGRTQIVFLRANEAPEIPLVTVEIKNGVIRQAYGLSNRVVDNKEHTALKKFAKKCHLTCKYSTRR
ncbi:putative PcfJ protein [Bacillus phage Bp8p-C]|uniref:Putative PcfJ protein n=2 Tax=Agatevirus Bp8pC TaxID=1910937 RepID=A0A0A0PJC1_9CAUD|nr:putative PcfJ protein [Bacillus phage Bp8p-C]YP_009784458.1 putative PcfJ protein [Bacillus phage Bp8p-T]AHJ87588.1 putative PcfJ protein [Bacillus phage Bp8p-C]AHJ87799.1 putative PcfJ protein [Bacillus phage Bp8p-T]